MPDQEEDKINQPASGQGPVSPTGGGGGAVRLAPSSAVASVGGGGTSGGGPSAAGGSFASLDKYLAANQGQAEPLAGKVMAPIQNQYSSLDTQNKNTLTGIQGDVTKGYTAANPDLLTQEAANPVSFASDAGNVSSFQKQLNDLYSGPLTAEGTNQYQTQQDAINSAIAQGQTQTGTEAGRKQLLTNIEATPTTGVTALNSAILSESPTYLGQVEKAYDPFKNLLSGLSTGAQDVNTKIAGATTEAQNASQAANKAIADQVQGLNTAVGNETQAAQGNINQYNQAVGTLQGAASNYQKDIADFLAANPNLTASTNPDLSAWANLTPFSGAAPTNATAATAQDYATANALQTLNGTAPAGMALNPTESNLAGTALPPTYQSIIDALNNGAVPAAMTNQVQGFGTQITNAYQPVATAQANVDKYNALQTQLQDLGQQQQAAQLALNQAKGTQNTQAISDAQAKMADIQKQIDTINQNPLMAQAPSESQVGQIAQGVQWLPKTATAYNSLLTKLQADLAPVQGINIPAAQAPASGPNVSGAEKALNIGTAGLTAPTVALGNEIANNPAATAQRAALFFPSFGTSLFLPQSTLSAMGNSINNAVSSIGNFFSGLF